MQRFRVRADPAVSFKDGKPVFGAKGSAGPGATLFNTVENETESSAAEVPRTNSDAQAES